MSDVTVVFSTSYAAWMVASERAKLLKIGIGQWYLGLNWGWRTQRSLERFRASALWRWFPKVAGFVELTTIDGIPSPVLLPSGRTEPYSSVQELDDVPYIGLSAFSRRDQVVTAKIAFPDDRAERMLREQSAQLPKGKRGVIMIAGPSSESELKVLSDVTIVLSTSYAA